MNADTWPSYRAVEVRVSLQELRTCRPGKDATFIFTCIRITSYLGFSLLVPPLRCSGEVLWHLLAKGGRV